VAQLGEEEVPARKRKQIWMERKQIRSGNTNNRRRWKKMAASTEYPQSTERCRVEAYPRQGNEEEARWGRKLP
jgi:hypothetical protein